MSHPPIAASAPHAHSRVVHGIHVDQQVRRPSCCANKMTFGKPLASQGCMVDVRPAREPIPDAVKAAVGTTGGGQRQQ